jgi:predicted DNA-binding protein (MmcQ/YjbR family)
MMATLAKARAVCKALSGATSDVKWGADLVYSVGGRMFAVMPKGPRQPPSIAFKISARLPAKARKQLGID